MAINFRENVSLNRENLLIWRGRYSKEEYPSKIVLNIFYDLLPLKSLWEKFHDSFGDRKYENIAKSDEKVFEFFREAQFSLRPNLIEMLKDGVNVDGLSSKKLDQFVNESKSNKAVEELEYIYVVRVAIKAAFISWFSYGLIGNSKSEAYDKVFSIQQTITEWHDFDSVFKSFAQSAVSEISGLSRTDGTVLTESLYKPLPNLW